jgi:hypothetical protein
VPVFSSTNQSCLSVELYSFFPLVSDFAEEVSSGGKHEGRSV